MVDHGEIAAARRHLGEQLRELRRAAGHTQHSLARAIPYSRSTLANVETGRQPAPREFWRHCDRELETGGTLTAGFDEIATLVRRSHEENAGAAVALRDRVLSSRRLEPADDSGSRLRFALDQPDSVDLVAVAQLRQTLQELSHRYDSTSSSALLDEARQVLDFAGRLRAGAPAGRVRRELFSVESEAATLMGQMTWDASGRREYRAAAGYFNRAVSVAREVDDRIAQAHALLRTSYVALYGTTDYLAGLTLAQNAGEMGSSSNTLSGIATLHVAEAHAYLGQPQECEQALSRAAALFEQRTDTDPAADMASPSQFGRLAGSCYLTLRKPKRAQAVLEVTAETLIDRRKSRAIVLGNLSRAYIRQRKVDQAVGAINEAIDVTADTRGGGGMKLVFTVGRELRPWRQEPAVADVYDRLVDLVAAA